MPVRVFVSSEMKTQDDKRRRQAAIAEIRSLGHEPVFFENLPGRPLADGETPIDRCRAMVRDCDLLIAIVNEEVTEAMDAELDEARTALGASRVFYYFVADRSRKPSAQALWSQAKKTNVLKEFDSEKALQTEVGKSVASYIEDAIKSARHAPSVLYKRLHIIQRGRYDWVPLELRKGDRVVITCESAAKFHCLLVNREEFAKVRNSGCEYRMPLGSDRLYFTDDFKVPKDDEYFVVLKRGIFSESLLPIDVKVVRRG